MQILRIIGYSDVFQGIDFFGAMLFWPAWSTMRGMPRSTLSQGAGLLGVRGQARGQWCPVAHGQPLPSGQRLVEHVEQGARQAADAGL
jgi:hypothetical protein